MKNIFLLLISVLPFSCKAQQEYPLSSDQYSLPSYSYIKDMNNELNSYVGTYKASFGNKQITLYISKEIKRLFDYAQNKYYKDVLSIKYTVQNSSGQILQTTQNQNFQPNQIENTIFSSRTKPTMGSILFTY